MPLYEYQCPSCSERIELIQRVDDPAQADCPKCGAAMKKLISAPAIQFKGSGFYKTDYPSSTSSASSSSKKSESSESSSASSATTPSTSTETKAEKKAAAE